MAVSEETVWLVKERADNKCEICGGRRGLQIHHSLYHRMKGKPELDEEENLELVCSVCHEYANTYSHRRHFWRRQCKIYGKETMREWHNDLDLKVKTSF